MGEFKNEQGPTKGSAGLKIQPPQPKPSFSQISQQLSTPNTLSVIATGLNIEQIRDILNSRMEFKIELKTSDTKDKSEEKEEKKEKEHELNVQEMKMEEEQEEIFEKIQEAAEKVLEERLEESETILERVADQIFIAKELGIAEFAETVHEFVQEIKEYEEEKEKVEALEEKERIEDKVEEIEERSREKIEVLDDLKDRIEEAQKDEKGTEGLLKDIEEISKQDKGELGKELEGLAKEIKDIMEIEKQDPKAAKEQAIEAVQDFISKHSQEIGIFKEIKSVRDKFDKLSIEEVKKELKDISQNINNTIKSFREKADRLGDILFKNKDAPQKVGEAVKDVFPKEKGKEKESEAMQNALRNVWTNSVINFIKEKVLESQMAKDKKSKERWEDALKKAGEWKESSIEEFNRRLSKILNRGEHRQAMDAAARSVIAYVEDIANTLERSGYAEALDKIVSLSKKKDMKPALDRFISSLDCIARKTDRLLALAKEGNFSAMLNEMTKFAGFDGSSDPTLGCLGRISIRIRERSGNSGKKQLIKEYIGMLNSMSGIIATPNKMKDAYSKQDYEMVDEYSTYILEHIGTMAKTRNEMNSIIRNKKSSDSEKRKFIARFIANQVFTPKNWRVSRAPSKGVREMPNGFGSISPKVSKK